MGALLGTLLCVLAISSLLKRMLRCTPDNSNSPRNSPPCTRSSMKIEEVRSLPITFYSSRSASPLHEHKNASARCSLTSSSWTHTVCAICLLDFVDGDLLKVLPACYHTFHIECIDAWLVSRSSCPTCRMHPLDAAADLQATSQRASESVNLQCSTT